MSLLARADAALQGGAWEEAAGLLRQALALEGESALLHAALGQALQALGRSAEAIASFRRAAELDPGCEEAQVGLATEFERARRLGERDECLRRWLQIRLAKGAGKPASRSKRVHVPDTTLVCVDCRYYDLAAHALERSLACCSFERALFLTDAEARVEGVETVRIAPIASAEQYSRFMIRGLGRYVETQFVLVVQYDGYVLSGAAWSPEFQRYDYIGAPWKGAAGGPAVGNGGFSLRSRKLLRALADPRLERLHPEDIAICRTYRSLLEREHGIRFAPAELAARFSFETLAPAGPTFGFHGIDHLYHLLDLTEAEAAAYRPPR